jgi:hypothetical protein
MTVINNGSMVTKDLVFLLDAASSNSFLGPTGINLATGFATDTTAGSFYIVEPSVQDVYIPAIGWTTATTVDVFNDFPAGWSGCCPAPIQYSQGYGVVPISPSTQYLYQIIYKTSDGYYHPNYMYRYENTSGGTYVTEGNVGDYGVNGNRIDLGNGWFMAWGTFTSQATTGQATFRAFHYRYNTFTRLQIAKVTIRQGSIPLPAKYMLDTQASRGTSLATLGGWNDVSTNQITGEPNNRTGTLVNNPGFDILNKGSVTFNGTNQAVTYNIGDINFDREQTIIIALKKTGNFANRQTVWNQNYGGYGTINHEPNNIIRYYWGTAGADNFPYDEENSSFTVENNELAVVAVTRNSSSVTFYKNGVQYNSKVNTFGRVVAGSTTLTIGAGYAGSYSGNIYYVAAYNRSLTAAEIKQNYDAIKGRLGLS